MNHAKRMTKLMRYFIIILVQQQMVKIYREHDINLLKSAGGHSKGKEVAPTSPITPTQTLTTRIPLNVCL
jgi:hypothetical protein